MYAFIVSFKPSYDLKLKRNRSNSNDEISPRIRRNIFPHKVTKILWRRAQMYKRLPLIEVPCQLQFVHQSSRQNELPDHVPGIDVRFHLKIADAYFDDRDHVRIFKRQNVSVIRRRQFATREPELLAGIIKRQQGVASG